MNRKEKYESPWMERTLVELEDGFCTASVVNDAKKGSVKTTGHELNELDATEQGWNTITGENDGWD